jgi:hypothetical protein
MWKNCRSVFQYCVRNDISFPANAVRMSFFKNVLTLAWWWPRDTETCSCIDIIKILFCSAVTCLFIVYGRAHDGMYNFKIAVYIVCKQFYFFPVPSLFPNLCHHSTCMYPCHSCDCHLLVPQSPVWTAHRPRDYPRLARTTPLSPTS